MNEFATLRKLPSADWIAFGIGLGAMFLSYQYPPLLLVVGLAVFGPSILREVGLLKDADEWTRSVMHRAGFHALLAVGVLGALNGLMPVLGARPSELGVGPDAAFGGETLRKALVWVFLISYLLQYWGGRTGAFRIMLGVAVLNLAPIPAFFRMEGALREHGVVSACVMALLFVALAFLARSRPRLGGWVLLAFFAGACVFMAVQMRDPRVAWAGVAVVVQALIVFGITGIGLLRDPS